MASHPQTCETGRNKHGLLTSSGSDSSKKRWEQKTSIRSLEPSSRQHIFRNSHGRTADLTISNDFEAAWISRLYDCCNTISQTNSGTMDLPTKKQTRLGRKSSRKHGKDSSAEVIDSCCATIVFSSIFKATLSTSKISCPSLPADNHPVNSTFALFYPPLYRSLILQNIKSRNFSTRPYSSQTSTGHHRLNKDAGVCTRLVPATDAEDCIVLISYCNTEPRPRFILKYHVGLFGPRGRRRICDLEAYMDITQIIHTLALHVLDGVEAPSDPDESDDPARSDCGRDSGIGMQPNSHRPGPQQSQDTASCTKTALNIDLFALHEMSELMADIRFFHRDCFVLTPAAGNTYWQISWTSAALQEECWPFVAYDVLASPADQINRTVDTFRASLRHTNSDVLAQLGREMSSGLPVKTFVRWGEAAPGKEKRLYCVPVTDQGGHGGMKIYWVCWITDIRVPDLWDLTA